MATRASHQEQYTKDKYVLHDAVQHADIDRVRLLVSQGVNLDELDNLGNSPLHWAVMGGYYDIVRLLLDAKANPNTISDDGYTPTWSAIDWGLSNIVDLLRIYGGKVSTDDRFDKTSWSVFKAAVGESLPEEDTEEE